MNPTSSRGALRSLSLARQFSRTMGWHPSLSLSIPTPMPIATPPLLSRVGRRRFSSLVPGGGGGAALPVGVDTVPMDENIKKQESTERVHYNRRLLEEAVAEGRRVLEFCHGEKTPVVHNHNYTTKSIMTKEKLQELERVVDRFLEATLATVPLSQAMAVASRTDNDDNDKNKERIKILHGAFLSLALKCITVLMPEGVDGTLALGGEDAQGSSSSSSSPLPPPPPLFDKALQLVTRARKELNFPCPLPLYQWLAVMVAQTSDSSSTITQTILQAGQWARDDFGIESIYQEPQEFFAQPLYHLAQRKRYDEMMEILLIVLETESFAKRHLREDTLKQILSVMQEDLKTHLWTSSSSSTTLPKSETAHLLLHVLLLLEPSIWSVFGFSASSLVSSPRSSQIMGIEALRGAIQELLSGGDNDNGDDDALDLHALIAESSSLIQALFPGAFKDDLDEGNEDFDNEDDNEDEDDDDVDDNMIYKSPKGSWEIILDMDSNMAVVGINRISNVDEEGGDDDNDAASDDDDDDLSQATHWDTRDLYTRSSVQGTLPDVVQQLEQVIGRPLQYSMRLERDLLRTMGNYDI